MDRDLGKCLQELFQSRQEGDYSDFVQVTAEAAERALKDAEMFVSRAAEVLQALLEA